MAEISTLDEALTYLRPHPSTKGPVILTPEKMREAVGVIQLSLAAERERCAAVADDLVRDPEAGSLTKSTAGWIASQIRSLPPQTEGGVVSLCKAKR